VKSLTEHLWFETPHRRDYLNITDTVAQLVRKSTVQEGLCLVNAMHITALTFVTRLKMSKLWNNSLSFQGLRPVFFLRYIVAF